jgi:hypothetical protein
MATKKNRESIKDGKMCNVLITKLELAASLLRILIFSFPNLWSDTSTSHHNEEKSFSLLIDYLEKKKYFEQTISQS